MTSRSPSAMISSKSSPRMSKSPSQSSMWRRTPARPRWVPASGASGIASQTIPGSRYSSAPVTSPSIQPSYTPRTTWMLVRTTSEFCFDIARAVSPGSGVGVSVLLRQPQGFEGSGVVEEPLDLDDAPISDGGDGSQAGTQVDPAGAAPAAPVRPSHDLVVHREDFRDHSSACASFPALVDFPMEAPQLLATAKRVRLGKTRRVGAYFHVLCEEVEVRVEVAGDVGPVSGPHDLHVLLRHHARKYPAGSVVGVSVCSDRPTASRAPKGESFRCGTRLRAGLHVRAGGQPPVEAQRRAVEAECERR